MEKMKFSSHSVLLAQQVQITRQRRRQEVHAIFHDILYKDKWHKWSFYRRTNIRMCQHCLPKVGEKGSKVRNLILFLSANPSDSTRIKVAEEFNIINNELRSSGYGNRFNVEQRHAVSLSDLSTHLLEFKPLIVHFSGHGSDQGRLIFQDAQGREESADPIALATLFKILNEGAGPYQRIKCVVLNACFSDKEQAKAISQYVDCVIGISDTITDESAITFSSHYYRALAYGCSVKQAFDLGCAQLGLENKSGQAALKMECKSATDPSRIFLVNEAIKEDSGDDLNGPASETQDDTKETNEMSTSDLLHFMDSRFNQEELKTLCFELKTIYSALDYDNLEGHSKLGKTRELIEYFERRNRLADLKMFLNEYQRRRK